MKGYDILTYSGSDPALYPYKNLIYTSFLKSLRFGNEWFKEIESDVYYELYHEVLDKILAKTDSAVRLAVLTDDIDTCIGWSLSGADVLHYVFVKGDIEARKKGIATSLLPKEFKYITQLTKIGKSIWKRKYPDVIFNPFLI